MAAGYSYNYFEIMRVSLRDRLVTRVPLRALTVLDSRLHDQYIDLSAPFSRAATMRLWRALLLHKTTPHR